MTKSLKQKLQEAGCKEVPKDHWIYSEGPSITLIQSRPPVPPYANTLAQRLMVELREARRDSQPLDATEVESLLEMDESEAVTWVASNWIEQELINIFICSAGTEPKTVIATHHGDRGVLQNFSGPWDSGESAKSSFGKVQEAWTDLND
jgi:hypothetical protein